MKVAIITITDGANYGNRLQNYALQRVLEDLGCEVETLQRRTSRDKSLSKKLVYKVKQFIKKIINQPTDKAICHRRKKFKYFNQQYIKFSSTILRGNIAPAGLNNRYDYFICGSDQIWNTRFTIIQEDLKNYLAAFADGEKRISYAASFGTDEIDLEYHKVFAEELARFKAISVREQQGVAIVKQLSGAYAEVVLDPSMLIKTDDWRRIEKKPYWIVNSDRLLVTYFMSGRSTDIQKYIEGVKEKYHCTRVVNLEMEFIRPSSIEDETAFAVAPDEFVWLISHASCVLTDSFHATAFSILFHKPFVVFQRQSVEKENKMESRIDSLLGYFGMTDRKDDLNCPQKYPSICGDEIIEDVLERERKKSIDFLIKSLNS